MPIKFSMKEQVTEKRSDYFFDMMIWGPLLLIWTCAVASSYWIAFLSVAGGFLSAHYKMRGFAYSLALIALEAVFAHSFSELNHGFHFGLELSCALCFLITA